MDGDSDTLPQLAVVVLLLGLSVPALGAAYADAGTPMDYSETLTVDYTTDSTVSETATSEGYGPNPTITADGSQLEAGSDYLWNDSDGSVDWINTTNSTSGDTAAIEYSANQRTGETEMAWTLISPLMGLFGMFALVSAIRVLWGYIAELWEATP